MSTYAPYTVIAVAPRQEGSIILGEGGDYEGALAIVAQHLHKTRPGLETVQLLEAADVWCVVIENRGTNVQIIKPT